MEETRTHGDVRIYLRSSYVFSNCDHALWSQNCEWRPDRLQGEQGVSEKRSMTRLAWSEDDAEERARQAGG